MYMILLLLIVATASSLICNKITRRGLRAVPLSFILSLVIIFVDHWLVNERGNLDYAIQFWLYALFALPYLIAGILILFAWCTFIWYLNKTLNNPLKKYSVLTIFAVSALLIAVLEMIK